MSEYEDISDAAIIVLDEFMRKYHSAAIPALLGACAMWSVENGGAELFRDTLKRLSAATHDMENIRTESAQ